MSVYSTIPILSYVADESIIEQIYSTSLLLSSFETKSFLGDFHTSEFRSDFCLDSGWMPLLVWHIIFSILFALLSDSERICEIYSWLSLIFYICIILI